ncbi:MAG: acyl carrier protein [Deltaproteobacteria bacterium]|nr:MAG: acyl carrier protein [Deltaproteobacteria bacterium]
MTPEEIEQKIVSMMVETFELDEGTVTRASRLYEDLELDSIDALDMVVKLQELMHRRVTEDEMRQLRTVGDVVDLVVGQHAQAAEAEAATAESSAG